MNESDPADVSRKEMLVALLDVVHYKPRFFAALTIMGIVVSVLEGVGLTFIVPIIELVQASEPASEAEGVLALFVTLYQTLGIPFTLGYLIAGVSIVMTLRYLSSFLYGWLRWMLRFFYKRHLQTLAFDNVLQARMDYMDQKDSDDILNAILTEAVVSSKVVYKFIQLLQVAFLALTYLLIALWLSPLLTVISVIVLGAITVGLRSNVDKGYDLGDLVADANEQLQEAAQAGTMGIRDIHIFDVRDEIYEDFVDASNQYTRSKIKIARNLEAMKKFTSLAVAVFVFVLVYLALRFANLTFSELGLFLFAMFQLGPKVSSMNKRYYAVENDLPHLVRTQRFIEELEQAQEENVGSLEVPDSIDALEFDDVSFSYDGDEMVHRNLDFTVRKGEFIAFVGQSGAGKSTIVSLIAQFYDPESGHIRANGLPIDEMDPEEWRRKIAIIRQNPFIFNDTLRYNLTVGNRDATEEEIDRACKIAKVDEFLDELPAGYDSRLGDDGARLSGGQKQRVALARALLKDAELLVLDEATSDLDSNLEREVQRGIEQMDRDYAIVAIAHRLSTIENADRIYTMENGRITEQGRHEELLANDGKYSELYTIQSEA